jgi:hypothetical protein
VAAAAVVSSVEMCESYWSAIVSKVATHKHKWQDWSMGYTSADEIEDPSIRGSATPIYANSWAHRDPYLTRYVQACDGFLVFY